MKAMPEGIDQKVRALKKQADDLQMKHSYLKAVDKYKEALALLPLPINQWKYIWILLPSIAENYWTNAKFNAGKGGGFEEALDVYKEIMQIDGAVGDKKYHGRIGQLRFELGQLEKAKDEFLRAYAIGGREVFSMMETKYFDLIKPIVESKELGNYPTDAASYEFLKAGC